MTYINITKFVLINELEKDHSMIVTRRLKDVVIFFQKILSFVLSRKVLISKTLIVNNVLKEFYDMKEEIKNRNNK